MPDIPYFYQFILNYLELLTEEPFTADLFLHHCCSQGIPSPSPSILTLGQFLRKKVASAQDLICEGRL
jgi:hypothetical protein